MSELKGQITAAMKDAMRAKDKPRLGTIRLILADLKRIEVDERIELDDERIITIMDKMLKQRRDSISQFEAANRQELADIEKAEITVIQSFMPASLSNEEIEQLVDAAITNTGASSMKDMGSVMGLLRPQLQGRADMAEVSKLIKARLS
ncbi:MAG: GatB/YqeY domain-containing protein [Pseudomonadales bacterium]